MIEETVVVANKLATAQMTVNQVTTDGCREREEVVHGPKVMKEDFEVNNQMLMRVTKSQITTLM